MYKIVTHPGSAHKDDFLAVCVLLATLKDVEVFRREPTAADLDDLDTYVVDVGFECAPERHNFDHHHNHSLPCAFHLVMQHLGHPASAMTMFGWYPHMSMMDVRGPYRTAEHLGVDSSVLFATSSPIDGYIISTFGNVDSLRPGDALFKLMKSLGKDMISLIERKAKRLERLKEEARVLPVKHLKVVLSEKTNSRKLAIELYLRSLDDESIVIRSTPSTQGEARELILIDDNVIDDFLFIEVVPYILFVHDRGLFS